MTLLHGQDSREALTAIAGVAAPGAADVFGVGSGDIAVAFDGRLDNRGELAAALGLADTVHNAELLVEGYHVWHTDLPARLSGDFAVVVADRVNRTVLLARDAVGARPLYFAHSDGSLLFASTMDSIRSQLADRARPNLSAIAQLLCAPLALQSDETFITGLQSLPPAHSLVFDGSGARIRQYWQAGGQEYHRFGFQDCVDEFRRLFFQAVQRRIPPSGRLGILVSGGLDSSSVFCCARELGADALGIYHGADTGGPGDETRFVRQLESKGAPIVRVPLLPSGYPDGVASSIQESELPLRDDLPSLWRRIADQTRAHNCCGLLTGNWADQVLFPFPPGYLTDAFRQLSWGTLFQHVRSYPGWFQDVPARVLHSAVAKRLLRDHVPTALLHLWHRLRPGTITERLLHPSLRPKTRAHALSPPAWGEALTEHGRAVSTAVRRRVHTLALESFAKFGSSHGLEVAHPFLDRELLTFMARAPGILQAHEGMPKALLRAAMRGIVPDMILDRRDKGDYTDVMESTLTDGAETAFQYLRDGVASRYALLDPELFSRDLAHLCSRAYITRAQAGEALASLYPVECWLRRFFVP